MKIEERYASNPDGFIAYDTERIRKDFVINKLFEKDEISLVYSHYDRFIVGGIMPVKAIKLDSFGLLKSDWFLERREIGIINIGGKGKVIVDGEIFEMNFKDALYLGKETHEVTFSSLDSANPAKFYFNSALAHRKYPSRLVRFEEAEKAILGGAENSNYRQLNKLLVSSILPTCQLQMGLTEIQAGSVWNTMPAHTHSRRMEVYMYFNLPENQAVCHFMGRPHETRHVWLHNEQAVISPPWSIHSGVGTSNYSFVWGMAGENYDYSDMDICTINQLK
ncbi:MAG TPA: 5-dehydro-4-deoxy-D-glucuronate isomerase [Bacteroidales bacterium]|nr:5-dehydro-4-deoxy-D-glucuronate isomerase [Bacteroidales bacterium]